MVSFHDLRYVSPAICEGRAFHLYCGAISRGRSGLTVVGWGLDGWKGSVVVVASLEGVDANPTKSMH